MGNLKDSTEYTVLANSHVVEEDGDGWFKGDVYVGPKDNVKKLATEDFVTEQAVQSDWNQNDETASDFIKNRPFYVKNDLVRTEINNWEFTAEGSSRYLSGGRISGLYGKSVIVTINGTEYESSVTITDAYKLNLGDGYVFSESVTEGMLYFGGATAGVQYIIKIETLEENPVVIPIDEKYIPDEIKLPEASADDEGKILSVKNGIWTKQEPIAGYVDVEQLVYEGDIVGKDVGFYTIESTEAIDVLDLVEDEEYRIDFNGLILTTICTNADTLEWSLSDKVSVYYTNSHKIEVYASDTGTYPEIDQFVNNHNNGGTARIKICHMVPGVKKIDPVFLPDILPPVNEADNGKFLRVTNGKWAAITIDSAEVASF